jgi:L-arabinose isomerase
MTRTPLATNLDAYEIWFVTGSQTLYGEETLRQVAEQSQGVVALLQAASDIPVGPFAIIGDDSIGRGIVETLGGHRSRAVLMQYHGVFTIGTSPRDAVKAAVMAEDVARTVHLARQLGEVIPIPQDKIDSLFNRYQNVYGQHGEAAEGASTEAERNQK